MKELAYEQLTLFREASHASLLVLPGSEKARMTTVSSGLKCSELYRKSGPLGSLVKMLLGSSVWSSTKCFLTWRPKTTPSRRLLFQLAPSTPRIDGIGASLLGTPTASMRPRTAKFRAGRAPNPAEAAFWPTPTARDYKSADINPKSKRPSQKTELNTAVILYPTPTTGAGLCGGAGNYKQLKTLEKSGQITEEERRSMASGGGGQLNPTWVEWLMGFPIGWTDLKDSETP